MAALTGDKALAKRIVAVALQTTLQVEGLALAVRRQSVSASVALEVAADVEAKLAQARTLVQEARVLCGLPATLYREG